ncbi:HPr family phosphocarrier protein [Neobacillus cucumis]|uniref:HPr family phosphocarrier protein n=1 Tax=Neobacillus cucumis TaxID=1740721 RepID=UPI002E1A2C1C|nr:HPr family phosphocarrier protein [Neobacillus cucumis]
MVEEKIVVHLQRGLQAQGATEFVKKASTFTSEVNIIKESRVVAGKSIMGVMCLAIRNGDVVTLRADGEDERKAIKILGDFLSRKK